MSEKCKHCDCFLAESEKEYGYCIDCQSLHNCIQIESVITVFDETMQTGICIECGKRNYWMKITN